MSFKKYKILILLFTFAIISCEKDDSNNIENIDYSYYPITVGNYLIYDITEINIDKPLEIYDTTEYQLKEIVESEYIGLSGKTEYRLERYIRLNETSSWQIYDIWIVYIDNNIVVKVEENISYVKMTFPVVDENSWNGNSFNTLDKTDYTITGINYSDSINSNYLDSLLRVEQINEESLIDKKEFYEVYMKNVGLVEKFEININSQPINGEPIDISVPIEQRITVGTIYKQRINTNYY